MTQQLIKPHGSDSLNPLYVADDAKRAELQKEAEGLPKLLVCSQAAANAVMMASGYFNPLTGYMNLADSLSVAESLKTTCGLFWPVPIVNVVEDVSGIRGAKRIALLDPNTGAPLDTPGMMKEIKSDLFARAHNDFEYDHDHAIVSVTRWRRSVVIMLPAMVFKVYRSAPASTPGPQTKKGMV